ncbi:PTS sugar transporter subunit IIB [Spiroplasma endosymbiont of Aspidapion aeneum]|uniref:PTS sugar transporter subunit IIB n=1 Tax=Spiroplasma endosymbiont of Aspidapion aeneum TaxID=3066276 RepID=UPI00313CE948
MKIVAVCGSGLGSSFIVEMNIKEVCKSINLNADVSHISVDSFNPIGVDLVVCGADIADSLNFENKIVLVNLMDKKLLKEKLQKFGG